VPKLLEMVSHAKAGTTFQLEAGFVDEMRAICASMSRGIVVCWLL
jgi:hypothetical protein